MACTHTSKAVSFLVRKAWPNILSTFILIGYLNICGIQGFIYVDKFGGNIGSVFGCSSPSQWLPFDIFVTVPYLLYILLWPTCLLNVL